MTNKIIPWGRCRMCRKMFPITDLSDRLPGKFVGTCERCARLEPQVESHEEKVRGVVYFVRGESSGLVKIGYTTNLNKHLKTAQTYSGEILILLATIQAEPHLEADLHLCFAKDKVRGDWFLASKDLLNYIGELT